MMKHPQRCPNCGSSFFTAKTIDKVERTRMIDNGIVTEIIHEETLRHGRYEYLCVCGHKWSGPRRK